MPRFVHVGMGKYFFNGVTKILKIRILDDYEDRSVSIGLRIVINGVTAWNFGSFIDLGLDVLSFVSLIA